MQVPTWAILTVVATALSDRVISHWSIKSRKYIVILNNRRFGNEIFREIGVKFGKFENGFTRVLAPW